MPEAYTPAATKEDGTPDLVQTQRDWMSVIERHEKKRMSWVTRSKKIVKIYADAETSTRTVARKYCVLWANVQTRMPSSYSRRPKCVVSRRYQTPNQAVRKAVLALERITNIQIEDSKLHEAIMSARLDRHLPGRGTIWIRFEASDDGAKVTKQKICADFVGFEDYGHGEARVFEEIDAQWRVVKMSEDELKERFGDDVMVRCGVTLDFQANDAPDAVPQASVYELWCKSRGAVYWLARTAKAALEVGEPPLRLKNFWPAPKPVFATLTNESCIPTPDYVYYQDQAEEITRLTRRIDKLTDSLKLVGFYPKGPSGEGANEIERALTPGFENKMVPIPSWAAFAEKGGVNAIVWLPMKDIAFIIEACVKLRQQLLSDVDQITGINDIERGATDANETLGAQQLKSQYSSRRQMDTKDDFVRFAKEACEIIAEIASEHLTSDELARQASMPAVEMDEQTGQPVTDPQTGKPVEAGWIKLLRSQMAREVLVDVETDSTIQPDEDAEKQRRVEMFEALNKGMAPLLSLQEMNPQAAAAIVPLWGDALLFMIRGFRAGREMEETVEETVKKIEQLSAAQAQQAQQAGPPQDPAIVKATTDAATAEKKIQADAQIAGQKEQNANAQKMKEFDLKYQEAVLADQRERDLAAMKMQNQREEQQSQMGFQREQASEGNAIKREGMQAKQAPAVGVQLGPDTEKAIAEAQATSANAMVEAANALTQAAQAQTQMTQAMIEMMGRPRRLVKDPKTGEKRAEMVMQ